MTNVSVSEKCEQLVSLLLKQPLLQGLSSEIVMMLAVGAQQQFAEPGTILFKEGDVADAYFLVESGQVEVFRYSHHGDERVFHVFEPGQLVADMAMFMPHGRYPMCARAQTQVCVYRLLRSSLQKACRICPDMAMNMLVGVSSALYVQVNKVDWIISSSAAERLANYLLKLKERQGRSVLLPINQRQLAAHLGIRAETLSRLFTDWQSRGYVTGRRCCWDLCDVSHLQRLASTAQRTF